MIFFKDNNTEIKIRAICYLPYSGRLAVDIPPLDVKIISLVRFVLLHFLISNYSWYKKWNIYLIIIKNSFFFHEYATNYATRHLKNYLTINRNFTPPCASQSTPVFFLEQLAKRNLICGTTPKVREAITHLVLCFFPFSHSMSLGSFPSTRLSLPTQYVKLERNVLAPT